MKTDKLSCLNVQQKVEINNQLIPNMDWIKLDGDPLLRKKSTIVEYIDDEIKQNIDKMVSYIDACYYDKAKELKIKPGIAIAAPQVGLNKRILYVHFDDENEQEQQHLLINPEIISYSQSSSFVEGGEGCLSVKNDVVGNVKRRYKIIVKAFDLLQNKEVEIIAKDLLSICLQHEIDHLDGILYHDKIDRKNPNYSEEEWIKI